MCVHMCVCLCVCTLFTFAPFTFTNSRVTVNDPPTRDNEDLWGGSVFFMLLSLPSSPCLCLVL